MTEAKRPNISCPFEYSGGRFCKGHIVRVEAYKADVEWSLEGNDEWRISIGEPRSHYHVFCSEKCNHAGSVRYGDDRMKFYGSELPKEFLEIMGRPVILGRPEREDPQSDG